MKKFWLLLAVIALLAVPVSALAQGELETYVSEDELVTFQYPAEWIVQDLGSPYPSVAIANTEDAMERRLGGETVESGDTVITMVLLPLEFISMMGLELPQDDLEALAVAAQPLFSTEDYPVEWGEIETVELDINEDETIKLAFMPASSEDADGAFYLITANDLLLIVTVEAYPDEYTDEIEATAEQIIPTFSYAGSADDVMESIIEAMSAPMPTEEVQ